MLQQSSQNARRHWVWIVVVLVVVAAIGIYWVSSSKPSSTDAGGASGQGYGKGKGKGGAQQQNVPVVVQPAKSGDIGVYINGLGAVTPLATVTIKTRVDGELQQVLFKEGQIVRKGELLAVVDPRTYEAALLQAQGQMIRDKALLANAKLDLERYKTLFEQDSIAQQQLATQESLVTQYEGTVKIDQAAIDTAKVNLIYCHITAPVTGRVGLRQVDPGNIVHAADTNGIVIITQLQPISVVYTMPEDNIPGVMQRLQAGEKLEVDAWDRAETTKLEAGTLLTMDNQIDPTTGTVKLRAQFDNAKFIMFPSQFVNTHMLVETRHNATLIPSAAIQRGTPGTFVYVVTPDNTVSVRVVKLGPQEQDRAAVDSGVAPGENVVIDGADKLRDGAPVIVATHDTSLTVPTKGKGGRRKGGGDSGATPPASGAPGAAPAQGSTPVAPGAQPAAGNGGEGLTPEQRKKRWDDLNARIDKGEFGEEIKKLPEDQRKQKMRELRAQREAQPSPPDPAKQ
jgi:membrane fusion protein, multidrug efflux system